MDKENEYRHKKNTSMKLEVKKELLTRLIIQLDCLIFEDLSDKKYKKEFIKKIQYMLHVLDNIII